MTWERARSDEQIEYRIQEIVDATARLYKTHRFEEITFAMIGKDANFTRSNLYRYFKNKEEIFLALISHDIGRWRDDILANFGEEKLPVAEFTARWVTLLFHHKRMIGLFTILYTLLEPNASLESLTAFKQKMAVDLGAITEVLMQSLPFPSAEAAAEFLFAHSSLAIGMYPMLNLTAKQKEAMAAVDMVSEPDYFQAILTHSIESLLRGLTS